MIALLFLGCATQPPPLGQDDNCAKRTAFYPDDDGDGVGEPTSVYIGCTAPAGWVTNVGSPLRLEDTSVDPADTYDVWSTDWWPAGWCPSGWWPTGQTHTGCEPPRRRLWSDTADSATCDTGIDCS